MIIWMVGDPFFLDEQAHLYIYFVNGAPGGYPLDPKNNIPEEKIMNSRATPKEKPGAIFHFKCKVYGRSTGANGVKLAAYRAGERLRSDLTGRIHNYRRKTEVAFKTILAPDATIPWVTDRSLLWNAVDNGEARKDAQLAREVEVALPLALSRDIQIELLTAWIQETFVSQGMVADICLHDKPGNPHAHVLLTLRELQPTGFGLKIRKWSDPQLVETWRASWATAVSRTLEKADLDIRIDHRSNKRQGSSATPTKHVGRATPWNGEKVAAVSMENQLIQIERSLQEQKQEQKKAAQIAAAQEQETQAPSPTFTSPQRPPRVRRPRHARVSPSQGFVRGSGPSF